MKTEHQNHYEPINSAMSRRQSACAVIRALLAVAFTAALSASAQSAGDAAGATPAEVKAILAKAQESVDDDDNIALGGFYAGMSAAEAGTLANYYRLKEGEWSVDGDPVHTIALSLKGVRRVTKGGSTFEELQQAVERIVGSMKQTGGRYERRTIDGIVVTMSESDGFRMTSKAEAAAAAAAPAAAPVGAPAGAAGIEAVGPVVPLSPDNSVNSGIAAQERMLNEYRSMERKLEEQIREAEKRNDSATVESLKARLASVHATAENYATGLAMMRQRQQMNRQLDDLNRERAQLKADAFRDRFSAGRPGALAPEEPPAGPSGARIDEVLPVLRKANIETMTIALPNDVRLLLSKLPDGSLMGTFEVTQDQWLSVMGGENPSAEDNVGDDRPVDSIWPADALAFVEKLNALPAVEEAGLKFRIPSEEEWEKACLAGNKKSRDFGLRLDGEKVSKKNFGEIAWFRDVASMAGGMGSPVDRSRPLRYEFHHPGEGEDEASLGVSHSVGRKKPNAFGLYDMHGNVAELTFAKDSAVAAARGSRFVSKGGYWMDGSDSCEAYKTGRTGVLEAPPERYTGAKQPTNYTLGLRVAASVLDSGISRIFAAAKQAEENGGAAFFGFYPGMPEADATKLAKHYGLVVGDPETRGDGSDEKNESGRCQFMVDDAAKAVAQIRFDIQALQTLTKERYSQYDRDKFCEALSKVVGKLDLVRDGKRSGETFLYRRNAPDGTAVSFGETVVETRDDAGGPATREKFVLLAIEDPVATARLAAARMAAANNARIAAVEPVLNKAGIQTKTIELPGGVKLLLTKLPDERYLGTFEVTQAQFVSLMGTNASQCVGADLPADSVSVQDCLAFIAKANKLPAVVDENLRFRLPSLVEWKTACRAGTDGSYSRRLDGTDATKDTLGDMIRPSADGKADKRNAVQQRPHPVGVAMPNAFGLYDMFGNVSEWVADQYTTPSGKHRYHMGGSWKQTEGMMKPVRADGNPSDYDVENPEKRSNSLGFRVSVVSLEREIQRAKEEAAKAYALSNNGRIDAVKPVLEKSGIETKEIELPGGLRMLLNKLPDGSWAGAFEVTQGQWKALLHDNPASFQGNPTCTDPVVLSIWRSWKDENPENWIGTGLPVDQMSPGDCRSFLALLNEYSSAHGTGLTFRFPTQDQWLYASRGGSGREFAKPLDGGETSVDLMGWHGENVGSAKRLQVVGQKKPNAFGLYDVHGNAAEFAETRHGRSVSVYALGGSVGTGRSAGSPLLGVDSKSAQQRLALRKQGSLLEETCSGPTAFYGFRVIATDNGAGLPVAPEMVADSNARIDAVKPTLDAKGIETKVLVLPSGVKLMLTKLSENLWAGTFEVTQAQYLSVLGEIPTDVKTVSGALPVDGVEKPDAESFLRHLGALPCAKDTGLVFRLPSLKEQSHFCNSQLGGGKKSDSLRPVGEGAPTSGGLYDMTGNANEWTSTLLEKANSRQQGGVGDRFAVSCGSEHIGHMGSSSLYSGDFSMIGFRVWAESSGSAKNTPTDPVVSSFVQDSNARIDAVKTVLDDAGIETRTIDLHGGVRILMNKLPNGLWMAAFETTQAQYASIFGVNPARIKGGDRAVDNVSWNYARIYAAALNLLPSVKASGLHFRLPSSSEWEYACRGGDGTAPCGKPLVADKGTLAEMGWYNKNSDLDGVSQTHRVGQLQPNAFGLYDMIGNVAEWTATSYMRKDGGPQIVGSWKIWRGGSWLSPESKCTAAYRGLLASGTSIPDTGFRLCATEDGTDASNEVVTFQSKEYSDAVKKELPPDDRTSEERWLEVTGPIEEIPESDELKAKHAYRKEMRRAAFLLQTEDARNALEQLGIDPDSLF